jgi:hypothetical protein
MGGAKANNPVNTSSNPRKIPDRGPAAQRQLEGFLFYLRACEDLEIF